MFHDTFLQSRRFYPPISQSHRTPATGVNFLHPFLQHRSVHDVHFSTSDPRRVAFKRTFPPHVQIPQFDHIYISRFNRISPRHFRPSQLSTNMKSAQTCTGKEVLPKLKMTATWFHLSLITFDLTLLFYFSLPLFICFYYPSLT